MTIGDDGIFVKNVLADSPAGRCGLIRKGDRLLEINGVKMLSSDHRVAVDAMANTESSDVVSIQLQRMVDTNNIDGHSKS